jgi:hypothetical protein
MAFIVDNKQDGKIYCYLSESARVNGKPRIVSQKYLGSAEEVLARLEGSSGDPTSSERRSFGDVCAVWIVLDRLGVIKIIDEVLGPRRQRHSGLRGYLHRPGRIEPGGGPVFQVGLLAVVGHYRRGPSGASQRTRS